jgi:hypothetical protein
MKIPLQIPPVRRDFQADPPCQAEGGVAPSQTPCDSLTGMARQLCYGLEYGIST